jgi:proteasome lid subunit RPN8/RPN11
MSERTLYIPEAMRNEIFEHASAGYPEEICGVLAGTGESERRLTGCYRAQNVHSENKTRRFLISPEDYRSAEIHAAEANAEVIGFYHSHPDHPAEPSEHDREFAWPWFVYIIVSVEKGHPKTMSGWELREDRTAFDPVRIVPVK